jgi:hypothetical protein
LQIVATICPFCTADRPLTVQFCVVQHAQKVVVFTICPTCKGPVSLVLSPGPDPQATADWFRLDKSNADLLTDSGWEILFIYPKPADRVAPEHTPADIARIFGQAHASLQRDEREAAAILFGKTLEVATKRIAQNAKGTLKTRIDALADQGQISADVKRWAHEIRLIRNDAAHEDQEPTNEDVKDIAEFTEAFLLVVFTMTEKFKQRASKRKARQ